MSSDPDPSKAMPEPERLFGILNLNKPEGLTSRDVVNVVQRLVRPEKVGHAGTLDPMATGVLLVCVGKATRLISILQSSPKTYTAEFQLGQSSDTDDSTGNVVIHELSTAPPDRSVMEQALAEFVGEIQQVPPQFSAVKVKGRRAYAKARAGEEVKLSAKTVVVHNIRILDYQWPQLSLEIVCGSGTYIRSIARDLGERLKCGGLMSALERTRIGKFDIASGVVPEDLADADLTRLIVDPINVVDQMIQYRCSPADEAEVRTGRAFVARQDGFAPASVGSGSQTSIALTNADGSKLLGLAEPKGDQLQPRQVFVKNASGYA